MRNLFLLGALLLPLTAALGCQVETGETPPQGEVTVTILFDNLWTDDRLETGWGFAALLETPDHTVLFDTGADGEALLRNMRLLGKDPMAIEKIVISHAHGDHTGGMQALFDLGLRPQLYLLAGFPAEMRAAAAQDLEVIDASPGREIIPGIRTTGQVGTEVPEQALIFETLAGTVVLTGCAHPGVIRMVEKAREISPGPLHLVMGGFHLMEASGEEIQGVLQEFQRLEVARAGPTHCSGLMTMAIFQEAYGKDFQRLGVGRVLTFPLAEG
jgi:7,8-dihydropterin-6-yl-methyl-4-(beta-D-ribofuranosyl)aminobenzene 5'-phosphate synthase